MTKHFLNLQLFIAVRRERFHEEGATAVEYSLMVGMLAFAIIIGVSFFGSRVAREYNVISNTMPTGLG